MIIEKILRNTIRHVIGHEPSAAELESAVAYLRDAFDDKFDLTKCELSVYDWRTECMRQCHGCGDWFLETPYKVDGFDFCSEKCAGIYYRDNMRPSAVRHAYYED